MSLVQVVHVTGPESIPEAVAISSEANGLLLDSGNQGLAIKELGGTGRVHDWELSAAIRLAVSIPVFSPGASTRADGRLDPVKLSSFMAGSGGLSS